MYHVHERTLELTLGIAEEAQLTVAAADLHFPPPVLVLVMDRGEGGKFQCLAWIRLLIQGILE